jgi:hypothetical protein
LRSSSVRISTRDSPSNLNGLILANPSSTALRDFPCRGGVPIFLEDQIQCLCPQTLYGSSCEYQSQRVSVTIQIGAREWRTPFILFVYLIDETLGLINSYHFIRYLSIRDGSKKFNFHLLYSSRPKLVNSTYSVRIDVFAMSTLKYRGSWLFAILFPWLPVYRLPLRLTLRFDYAGSQLNCSLQCNSQGGQCVSFVNMGEHFCRCKPGWSGPLCSQPYQCDCSPDSLCVGSWNNRSICVCPTYKHGRRCYLKNQLCEERSAKKCLNNGQCIPRDQRISLDATTTCSCPERFEGDVCQWNKTQIDIAIAIPNIRESLLIHFIEVKSHPL